jgi:hypothetical protein
MFTTVPWLKRLLTYVLLAAASFSAVAADTPPERCPSGVDWTDEVVAKAVGLSESRLAVLKSARVLSNTDVCTMPKSRLERAIWRSENPKPDSPGEWAKFRAAQQADETGIVKPDGLLRAIEQRAAIIQRAALAGINARPVAGIGPGQWTELGPGNIGGRVRAIAIHPTVAGTMWAGSVSGGIWRTINDGAGWTPVNDFAGNLSISSIVISHANPNVMYASTGEGFFNIDAVRGAGIFRSTDGGVTWAQLPSTNPTLGTQWYYINRLVMHPSNANILLAATNQGLYRTTDGGTTWSLSTSPQQRVPDVQFNPLDGNKAVMGSASFTTGSLMYSIDAGATWLASNLIASGRAEIAFSRQANVVYASVDMNNGEIYRSADNGATWALRARLGHLGGQGWYDNALWVDPIDSNHLIAGGIDLFRSTNGGLSWTQISQWWAVNSGSVHADHHVIVNSLSYNGSTNRTVYFGNDGGVYKAQDITAVTSPVTGWTPLNNGLSITQFYSGAGHNGLNGRIIGGTQDNGSLRNAPAGTNWSAFFGGDGGASAIDPTDGNYIYGEYVNLQIHRSTNGGATQSSYIWPGIADASNPSRSNFISPFVLDPSNPNTMLAGGESVWRSTNVKAATPTWTSIMGATGGGGPPSFTSAIAVAPQNSNVLWIGKNGGQLYKSVNGTVASPTWTQMGAGALPAGRQLLAIHVDSSNANVVYVGFGGYSQANLWKTTDGGTTWTSIGGTLPESPIRSVTTSPLNPSHVYAATEVGVFASENAGSAWGTTNDGPANVSVDQLFWLDATTLVAATHGRGMFKTTVAGGSSFRLSAATYSVNEATASITIPVIRSLTTGSSSVAYATANGTATAGSDYTATSGTLNFSAGVDTLNIVVPILNDTAVESDETFTVSLSSPVNAVLGTPASATVTITNNAGSNPVLSVSKAGTGSGTVTSSPAGINCGATCSASFTANTSVTLTAAPASGSTFAGWTNGCTGTASTCVVSMTASKAVTATFNLVPTARYALGVRKAGTGDGTVNSNPPGISCGADCLEFYPIGTIVTLTAAPAAGSTFSGWSGACTGTSSICTVTLPVQTLVTASFAGPSSLTTLTNGQVIGGLSGGQSSEQLFVLQVPNGATNLEIAIAGGSGDADLYVRFGQLPSTSVYDCSPFASGSVESCVSEFPLPGNYFILVHGYSLYSDVSIVGSYTTTGGSSKLRTSADVTRTPLVPGPSKGDPKAR